MRTSQCAQCSTSTSLSETFRVGQEDLCQSCAEARVKENNLTSSDVKRNVDPTVCVECRFDAGSRELPLVVGLPLCEVCTEKMIRRPYPGWVKAFLVGLVFVTLAGFGLNFKYIRAFALMKQGTFELSRGNADKAYRHVKEASELMPQVADLKHAAYLFEGLMLLQKGDAEGAILPLKKVTEQLPQDKSAKKLLMEAQASAHFDKKDYAAFYGAARDVVQQFPDDPMAVAQMSSAAACMFAVTSLDQYRIESQERLDQASKMVPAGDPQFADYAARIGHRLKTREIITKDEYDRRLGSKEGK